MLRVFMDGFNLSRECATDLLSGAVKYEEEGDTVVFEYEKEKVHRTDTFKDIRIECHSACFQLMVSTDKSLCMIQSGLSDDDCEPPYKAAVDTLESLILALACQGVDVTTDAFKEAIDTTIDAIANNYGDE